MCKFFISTFGSGYTLQFLPLEFQKVLELLCRLNKNEKKKKEIKCTPVIHNSNNKSNLKFHLNIKESDGQRSDGFSIRVGLILQALELKNYYMK